MPQAKNSIVISQAALPGTPGTPGRSDIVTRRTIWKTAQAYLNGSTTIGILDIVKTSDGKWFKCKLSHTSGTFSSDLSAGRWEQMNWFENVATDLVLSRKIISEEIDVDNLIARNMRTANSGARVEAFGSEQNFYNENGVKQMQIGIVNGNVVLTYFAADGSKLYDLGPGGFNWGSIKPASWTPYTIKRMDTPTLGAFPAGGAKPTWGNLESYCAGFDLYAAISGQTYYTYYAGVNPTITEADRAKEQFLYATQSLTSGYCLDGWYISVEKPRVLPGEHADEINPSVDWLKPAPLNRNYAIHTRRLFEYIGGETARIMNVAWNDRSAVPEV